MQSVDVQKRMGFACRISLPRYSEERRRVGRCAWGDEIIDTNVCEPRYVASARGREGSKSPPVRCNSIEGDQPWIGVGVEIHKIFEVQDRRG